MHGNTAGLIGQLLLKIIDFFYFIHKKCFSKSLNFTIEFLTSKSILTITEKMRQSSKEKFLEIS